MNTDQIKKIALYFGVTLVITFVIFFIIVKLTPSKIQNNYYTIEPEPWIEETPYDDNPKNIEISVSRATRGKSVMDFNKQEYYENGLKTLFSSGIYYGQPFEIVYLKEGYKEEYNINDYALIDIGPKMDPTDGIIEGFILGKYEEDNFVFYLFVDEDWKEKIEFTNILYANDLTNPKIKQFDFSNFKDGIYIDKVDGNFDWFETSPRKGGIYLGEITKDTLKLDDVSNSNLTFIYVR